MDAKTDVQVARFSRYFWYAIGEILLVVTGILIALNINNWNDENQTSEGAPCYSCTEAEDLRS